MAKSARTPSVEGAGSAGGLRERKRRETLKRITDVAVRLFIAHGYEATTLDAIAAEAGISRRTFFYYFKSKDDILLHLQSGLGEMLAAALQDEPMSKRPIAAMRDVMLRTSARFPADEMLALDRLMRSSETVQTRKKASYAEHEETVFAALRKRWPEPEREAGLRAIAMASIGVLRLSLERFGREEGKRPLPELLREGFAALDAEI